MERDKELDALLGISPEMVKDTPDTPAYRFQKSLEASQKAAAEANRGSNQGVSFVDKFLGKVAPKAEKVLSFTGGSKVADAIGTITAQLQQAIQGKPMDSIPFDYSAAQYAGDTALTGSNFMMPGAGATVLKTLTRPTLMKTLTETGKAGLFGYGVDKASELADEGEITAAPGVATALNVAPGLLSIGGRSIGKGMRMMSGLATGKGNKAVESAFDIGKSGSKAEREAYDLGVKAVDKGGKPEEEIVKYVRDVLSNMKGKAASDIDAALTPIFQKTNSYDVSGVETDLLKHLDSMKIKYSRTKEGGLKLNFTGSDLAQSPTQQNQLRATVNDFFSRLGLKGGRNARSLHGFKMATANSQGELGYDTTLTQPIWESTRKTLGGIDGYDEAMKPFEEQMNFIKELEKGLTGSDALGVEGALNRMLSSFKEGKGYRYELLQKLNDETDGQLIPTLTGLAFRELIPDSQKSKIVGTLGKVGAGVTAGTLGAGGALGSGFLPSLLLGAGMTLPMFSPKLVGKAAKNLGGASGAKDAVVNSLIKKLEQAYSPEGSKEVMKVLDDVTETFAKKASNLTIPDTIPVYAADAVKSPAYKNVINEVFKEGVNTDSVARAISEIPDDEMLRVYPALVNRTHEELRTSLSDLVHRFRQDGIGLGAIRDVSNAIEGGDMKRVFDVMQIIHDSPTTSDETAAKILEFLDWASVLEPLKQKRAQLDSYFGVDENLRSVLSPFIKNMK